MALPYVITILVTAGDPDGVRIVEKSNWTGRGVMFSRSDLGLALADQGLASPGVYVLLGDDPEDDYDTQIYVGKAENVGKRLRQHLDDDAKEFWSSTLVFLSGNQSLNQAHVSYLESELIRRANDARRARVANGNQPSVPQLPATDEAVAKGFLAEVMAIFPVVGVHAFEVAEAEPAGVSASSTEVSQRRFHLEGSDAKGEGEERSDGFFVFEGAIARVAEVESLPVNIRRQRARMVDAGDFEESSDGSFRLRVGTLFKSPSTAAAVLMARNANGRVEWKDTDGVTLKQRQIEQSEAAAG